MCKSHTCNICQCCSIDSKSKGQVRENFAALALAALLTAHEKMTSFHLKNMNLSNGPLLSILCLALIAWLVKAALISECSTSFPLCSAQLSTASSNTRRDHNLCVVT